LVVRGPRLALRYPRPADAAALFELGRDPEVVRHFSWGPYAEQREAAEFIEALAGARESGERLELAIVERDSDRPIGITGFSDLSPRDRRATVGTWLGRAHWGTGANEESKALVLGLGFRALGLERVTALASPDNPRSLAALERLGFVREGVLRAWHRHRGEPRDVAILRMLRADWEASPLARVPVEVEGEPPPRFAAAHSQRK
jgi:ribosomal-protein-alanine N-acetyltransferase